MTKNTINYDGTLPVTGRILQTKPVLMSFRDASGEIGKLDIVDGKLEFSGNVSDSANIFFDEVIKMARSNGY